MKLQRLIGWHRTGQWRRAAAGYREILRASPECVPAWHFHALLLYERGHRLFARRFIERALELAPEDVAIRTNLARMLRETGEPQSAEAHIDRILGRAPEHVPAWIQLALLRIGQERGEELRAPLTRLLEQYPQAAKLWTLIGLCHEQAADWQAAMAAHARAARLTPRDPEPWLHQAEIEERLGRVDAAERDYRHALELDPGCASAVASLGSLASQRGDFKQGEAQARKALAIDPATYSAWLDLVLGQRERGSPALIAELEAAARRAGDDPEASPLYFALGMCREASSDYDGAFAAYAEANARRAREIPYDRDKQLAYFQNIVAHLDEGFAGRAPVTGNADARPIFILGMPRSGTTLTESLVAAHSDVHAGGEMHWIHDLLRRAGGRENATERVGEWLASRDDAELQAIARDWAGGLDSLTPDGQRITDKMPTNFMLVPLVHACFPAASIIHVRRDPLDNCFSCFATAFGQGHSFSNDLTALGEFYTMYEALMERWRGVLGPGRFIEVSYENLVTDPETAVRELIAALGLPWEDACLSNYRDRPTIRTASLWQARQPVYRSAQGRWQRFARHLRPLQAALADPAAARQVNPTYNVPRSRESSTDS